MKKIPLFLLMLNTFIVLLGVGIIIPVLPAYLDYFHASGMAAGLLVAMFGIMQFFLSPIGGRWADRFGRRPMLLAGLIMNGISHLLFAVADHIGLLYLSRMIGGIGLGFSMPASMAYVADVTDRENRAKGMGWISASVSLGMAVGPGIGGLLAEISIRAPYYTAAVLSLLAALTVFWLPETRRSQAHGQGAAPRPGGDAGLFSSIARSFHAPYFILLILGFILHFGLMNFETAFPLLANDYYAYTSREISIIITSGAIMGVIVQYFLLSRLIRRYGAVRLINGSLFLAACTLSLLLAWGDLIYVLLVSMVFFASQSMLRPAISTLLSTRAGEHEQGYVQGLGNTYMSIGNVFGPLAAGVLYDVRHTFPYLFGSLVLLLGMILFAARERRAKRESADQG
jgi:DHA1 family multidrug resistance protein-like MFS transporter